MYLIMLGAPGSGKGTQASLISKRLNIPHISSGDLLRKNPNLPKEIEEKMKKGIILKDEEVLGIVEERLRQSDAQNGWILDGFPRTTFQADKLSHLFPKASILSIYLSIPDEKIKKRIINRRTCKSCGQIYNLTNHPPKQEGICDACGGELVQRNDDTPEVVTQRLEEYHKKTAPVIEYYQNQGNLITIDCKEAPGPKEVDLMIQEALKKFV